MFPRLRYSYKSPLRRILFLSFDVLGFALIFPIRWLLQKPYTRTIRKILVIRIDHLGDAVMIRPALKTLQKRYPKAQIHALLSHESAPLFAGDHTIAKVIVLKHNWFVRRSGWWQQCYEAIKLALTLKREKYDLGIDFRGDVRNIILLTLMRIPLRLGWGHTGGSFLLSNWDCFPPKQHQVQLNVRVLKSLNVDPKLGPCPIPYTAEKKKNLFDKLQLDISSIRGKKIVVHPEAGYASKKWAVEKYRTVINQLTSNPENRVFVIGADRKERLDGMDFEARVEDLRGLTRIEELPILFDACDLFIGNDSGPAHIAAMQRIPSVILFSGTNQIEYWKPWSENTLVVSHAVPCSPCEAKVCPLMHHDCMEKISVQQVMDEIKRALPIESVKAG